MNRLYLALVASRVRKALEDAQAAEAYDNQVLKGRAREIFISDLLRPFLSRNFDMCTGHIIDSTNGHSRQIDVIVFDSRIVPPIMLTEGEGVIPYEAVLATVEVKSTLDANELDKSIENARSIKLLHANFAEVVKKNAVKYSPVCYIFAFKSDLAEKDEQERLGERVDRSNLSSVRVEVPISGLCVADKCFVYCRDANCCPPLFESIPLACRQQAVFEFLMSVVNRCNERASERGRLYLDPYLR